jgi:ABC-type transport system involved in multi-copper enzyme maturation permease subunit
MNIPMRTTGYMGYFSQHDRFFSGFDSVDYAFIIRVVLSLLVIFLAYNSISEEKTRGTLKLSLSNRLPRDQLLLGKFLGGLFVIVGSLALASLVALLILLIHPAVNVTGSIFLRMICMFGMSILYLLCFYTITLFVSVIVNRPAISLMILLQIWIFLIVIYPNLSVILSKQWVKLPSAEELADKKRAATQPYEEEYQRIQDAFHEMVVRGENNIDLQLQNVEINAKQTELQHQVDVDFSNRLTHQVRVAQTLSLLSPAVLYDMVMQRFSQTNIEEFDNFLMGVKEAWNKYVELYKLRYSDIEAYRKEKVPEFNYPSESIGQNIVTTLPQCIILCLFCILFFTLGYVNFLRKDVR